MYHQQHPFFLSFAAWSVQQTAHRRKKNPGGGFWEYCKLERVGMINFASLLLGCRIEEVVEFAGLQVSSTDI